MLFRPNELMLIRSIIQFGEVDMILVFILGLIIGSFLNVCIYRIPRNMSIITPPSKCGNCGHGLGVFDLIPLASYLFLKGRCRYCGTKISKRYPLVELFTGLIFLLVYYSIGFNILLIKYLILSSILIVITFIDLEHKIIPDGIVIFTIISGIILNIYVKDISFLSSIIGFFLGGGVLLLIALISGGAMGGGDIKFMAAAGIYLGFKAVVVALLISFIFGGIIGLALLLLRIKSRKDYIPFGPFLALGILISSLYYDYIIYWYFMNIIN